MTAGTTKKHVLRAQFVVKHMCIWIMKCMMSHTMDCSFFFLFNSVTCYEIFFPSHIFVYVAFQSFFLFFVVFVFIMRINYRLPIIDNRVILLLVNSVTSTEVLLLLLLLCVCVWIALINRKSFLSAVSCLWWDLIRCIKWVVGSWKWLGNSSLWYSSLGIFDLWKFIRCMSMIQFKKKKRWGFSGFPKPNSS